VFRSDLLLLVICVWLILIQIRFSWFPIRVKIISIGKMSILGGKMSILGNLDRFLANSVMWFALVLR
jgi:hypothetical protein